MTISDAVEYKGKLCHLEYSDMDDFSHIPVNNISQVYAVALCSDKLVIAYNGKNKSWTLPGGKIEPGESLYECLVREMIEETNMKVNEFFPIGGQYIVEQDTWQLRYACKVEEIGPFISDPDGGITKIKLIDPNEIKEYIDWGKIGDHIIDKGLKILSKKTVL